MFKYTLVPKDFFSPDSAASLLSSVAVLDGKDSVKNIELPAYKAVLIYTGEDASARILADMVEAASRIDKYNKVVARVADGEVTVLVAEGRKLMILGSYPAPDDVTAQYYIFACLRQFQMNPEVSTIYFYGAASDSIKQDLFRYFNSVEVL